MQPINQRSVRPAAVAALLAAVAIVAVALVTLADEGQEVSRASGILPCWLAGDCSDDLPDAEAVHRWGRHEEQHAGLPCEAGGDCDGLPSRERIHRWRRDGKSHAEKEMRMAQGIAKRNGLPVPHFQPSQTDEHDIVTPDTLQQKLQDTLMRKALARTSVIERQVLGEPAPATGYDAKLGKGLLSHGKEAAALLTNHPTSKKNINEIIAEVQKAEEAQAEAKKAQMEAVLLKQDADHSQQDAQLQAKHAQSALAQAKAMEQKHKKAEQKVAESQDELRYANKEASEAEHKLAGKKIAGSRKASPSVQLDSVVADPWQAMAATPVPEVEGSMAAMRSEGQRDDDDAMMKQYKESQQKYAAATAQTKAQAAQLKATLGTMPEGTAVESDMLDVESTLDPQ